MADSAQNALDVDALTPGVKAALKDFVENVAQQSKRQSALIDTLVGAVKALNHELHAERARAQLLDARLGAGEERIEDLARAVDALRRQGWVQ
jgi:hypothetical protein